MKSEGKNGPVPVAGRAETFIPVCQYNYCNYIM